MGYKWCIPRFKWLSNPQEPDTRKRITAPYMRGIMRLSTPEKSPYKPTDLWTTDDSSIFLKYCPSRCLLDLKS